MEISTFNRFAFYFLPAQESQLGRFGAAWLGWSIDKGVVTPFPDPVSHFHNEMIAQAGKYGFHATLKPPFRLHEDTSIEDLIETATSVIADIDHFELPPLMLDQMDDFFVLRTKIDCPAINNLAQTLVTKLDGFRARPFDEELRRRRSAGLSERQEELLLAWGYPFVDDEFRFHLTLTNRCDQLNVTEIDDILKKHIVPEMLAPMKVTDVGFVGEAEDGRFHLIKRIPFGH